MSRILVGLDGSPASRSALHWATRVALNLAADVVVVSALDALESDPNGDSVARRTRERENEMGQWTADAMRAEVCVSATVHPGDPRSVLLAELANEDVDLIVLGDAGRQASRSEHLGSTVEYVAQRLTCPLAVVPVGAHPVRRIVLGLDGSTTSTTATEWCARFAAAVGAAVVAVEVSESPTESIEWDIDATRRAETEREIGIWTDPVRRAGVEVETYALLHQHPAHALAHIAADRHADLIVVGSRGAGGVPDLRIGGVAMKLLHAATLPLVLVPPKR